jgi:uncharacterized protein YqjF (DUF2071 family)
MSEWLSNRMSVLLGPSTFGLPYRFARFDYQHQPSVAAAPYGLAGEQAKIRGQVLANEGRLSYRAAESNDFEICEPDSLTEFLLERYTAFTQHRSRKRFFRIWHEPWKQAAAKIHIAADNLIRSTGDWWQSAHCIGGNYSRGVDVWMGWPHKIDN